MDLASLIAFMIALAIAAAIPGPGIAALVGRALGVGFWPTMPMLFGVILGDLFYLTAAVVGLGFLASVLGGLFLAVRIAGAAYLVWLAWRLWTARHSLAPADGKPAEGSPAKVFLLGFALTLGNPKTILFYLALLPTLLDLTAVTPVGYAEASVLVVVILLLVLTPYVWLAATARRVVFTERRLKLMNRTAAVAMAGAAGAILTR